MLFLSSPVGRPDGPTLPAGSRDRTRPGPETAGSIPFVHLEEGTMRRILIAVIGVAALAGCGKKPETQAAADSASRDIQLPKPDSAVALNDKPPSPPPEPAPAVQSKAPPARRSSAARPEAPAAPAPAP